MILNSLYAKAAKSNILITVGWESAATSTAHCEVAEQLLTPRNPRSWNPPG